MMKEININEIFEKIDKELISKNIPITHRYMEATSKISVMFKVPIPISPKTPLPNNKLGNQLGIWLSDWYEKKYGDKQKINFDLGVFYINIRGDLWKYRIPCFYGTCNFFVNQDLSDKGNNSSTNIMRMCDGMTQAYVNSLNDKELHNLFEKYQESIEVFQIFRSWRTEEVAMLQAIHADIRNITIQLDSNFTHYGQALFSYLQVAEKIIKSWLLNTDLTLENLKKNYGHQIEKLAIAFNDRYENTLNINLVKNLKNNADLRYGNEQDYSSKDIILAQDALFHIILTIGDNPQKK